MSWAPAEAAAEAARMRKSRATIGYFIFLSCAIGPDGSGWILDQFGRKNGRRAFRPDRLPAESGLKPLLPGVALVNWRHAVRHHRHSARRALRRPERTPNRRGHRLAGRARRPALAHRPAECGA